MQEMPSLNMPVQRLKVAILKLDVPCSGPVPHSGEILTTGKSHGKKPDTHYSPTGRRNHGSPLKRLLDTWDRNGSTSGLTPWQIWWRWWWWWRWLWLWWWCLVSGKGDSTVQFEGQESDSSWTAWLLDTGAIGCTEMSVTKYQQSYILFTHQQMRFF